MYNDYFQIYILIFFISIIFFILLWYFLFIVLRVPSDDRKYLDRPPLFYRLFGFFINIIAFYLAPVIKESTYKNYEEKII